MGAFTISRCSADEETNTAAARDRYEIICRVFVKPTKTARVRGTQLRSDHDRRRF